MKLFVRVSLSCVVLLATYYFLFWTVFVDWALGEQRLIADIGTPSCALAAAGFVWWKSGAAPGGLFTSVLYGAIVMGALWFSVGFFGPVLFGGGNQGPLMGIFVTGPAGFVLGAVGGLVSWAVRKARSKRAVDQARDEGSS